MRLITSISKPNAKPTEEALDFLRGWLNLTFHKNMKDYRPTEGKAHIIFDVPTSEAPYLYNSWDDKSGILYWLENNGFGYSLTKGDFRVIGILHGDELVVRNRARLDIEWSV